MVRRVLVPLMTPFDEKRFVEEPMMRELAEFYVKAGAQGLFVLGSSAQGPVMSITERKRADAIVYFDSFTGLREKNAASFASGEASP